MIKMAIPNKGALSDGAVAIFEKAGYKAGRHSRELVVSDPENNIEFIFLRPRDIAVYVGNGLLDLGVTGRDLASDSMASIFELMPLNFGKSKFCYAVKNKSKNNPENFAGKKIATSYPNIVRQDLKEKNIDAEIIRLDGAVEISTRLGVADLIADVVESGRTLKEAGLKIAGEPIMESESILISGDKKISEKKEVEILMERLKGVVLAEQYLMVEYDISNKKLEQACSLTPGIESPTVAPLSEKNWSAVKSMVISKNANMILDKLQAIGAKGIVISDIKICRI